MRRHPPMWRSRSGKPEPEEPHRGGRQKRVPSRVGARAIRPTSKNCWQPRLLIVQTFFLERCGVCNQSAQVPAKRLVRWQRCLRCALRCRRCGEEPVEYADFSCTRCITSFLARRRSSPVISDHSTEQPSGPNPRSTSRVSSQRGTCLGMQADLGFERCTGRQRGRPTSRSCCARPVRALQLPRR
jgi:hypothetical protein